jgi:hypothetical protein
MVGFDGGMCYFYTVVDGICRNCTFLNCGTGAGSGTRIRFLNNRITGGQSAIQGGVLLTNGCVDCQIVGNVIDSSGNGITINDSAATSLRNLVEGNTITNFSRIGIEITTSFAITSQIDGLIYFRSDAKSTRRAIVSVKGGDNVGVPMIRDLKASWSARKRP